MNIKSFFDKYTEKTNSTFKRLFITFFCGLLPFLILNAILRFAEIIPVNFNGEKYYGYKALLILICFSPFIAFMFSFFTYIWLAMGHLVLKGLRRIFIS